MGKKMKGIRSVFVAFALLLGICGGLVGCADERFEYTYAPAELYALAFDNYGNEYKIDISREKGEARKAIEFNVEYLSRFDDDPVEIGLKGIYETDGTPLSEELYHSGFDDSQSVALDAVGTKVITKPCAILYSIKGNGGNGTTYVDCELTFNFNVTVKPNKILHEYVSIPSVEIPYAYFECEFTNECTDAYDLSKFNEMIGAYRNTDDLECGYSMKHIASDGSVLNSSSSLVKRQTNGDTVLQTEKLHISDPNVENSYEVYQYTQLKGADPNDLMSAYSLNETDGVFSASKHKQGGHYGFCDLPVSSNLVKNGSNLLYRTAEKDGYLYLSVSGILSNNEYWSTRAVKATYIIKENKIVAWLYEEMTTSPYEDTVWNTVEYCIPLEGDVEIIEESVLEGLCELY